MKCGLLLPLVLCVFLSSDVASCVCSAVCSVVCFNAVCLKLYAMLSSVLHIGVYCNNLLHSLVACFL